LEGSSAMIVAFGLGIGSGVGGSCTEGKDLYAAMCHAAIENRSDRDKLGTMYMTTHTR
jgi:hypothetical protein